MKKLYSFRTTFFSILFLAMATMQVGCSKEFTADVLSVEKQKLTGNSAKPITWKLVATVVGGASQATVPVVTTQYMPNGTFTDNQGCKGSWELISADLLSVTYTNFISGVKVTQNYSINNLNDANLSVNYTSGGKNIQLSYVSIY